MRKLFPGYYRPKKEEFEQMMQECIFVFDTNVLLDIYRYTPATRDNLLEILKRLQDRIWIPHQVGKEFSNLRLSIISQQEKVYDDVEQLLRSAYEKLESHRKHPYIDFEQLSKIYRSTFKKAQTILRETRAAHPDLITNDPLADQVDDIFNGKIGDPYLEDRYDELRKEAEERIKAKIPPGYKDSKKPDPYGDVILWFQLIDFATSQKKPVVLVTKDVKEDWWLDHDGKTIGPRPELVAEMQSKAGVRFYMYQTEQFMRIVQEFLDLQDQSDAIQEIREIQEQDEADQLLEELAEQEIENQIRPAIPIDLLPSFIERVRQENPQIFAATQNAEAVGSMLQHHLGQSEEMAAEIQQLGSAFQQYLQRDREFQETMRRFARLPDPMEEFRRQEKERQEQRRRLMDPPALQELRRLEEERRKLMRQLARPPQRPARRVRSEQEDGDPSTPGEDETSNTEQH